jgi:hypothetical protein
MMSHDASMETLQTMEQAKTQLRKSERGRAALKILSAELTQWPFDALDNANQEAVCAVVFRKLYFGEDI